MPFTLAHPALALSLKKLNIKLSATALVAGSMVPDFETFLQMRDAESIGHRAYGILIFDLPVGLIACYVFHNLLKYALIPNLPTWYRWRFEPSLNFKWNEFAAENKWPVFFSLLTGIITHLFWDGFTHHDGIFVTMIPVLSEKIQLLNHSFPVHFMLQVISSIIGLWVLQIMVASIPGRSENASLNKSNFYYWPVSFILLTAILTIRLLVWPQFNSFLGVLRACMGSILYAWVLVSILFRQTYSYSGRIIKMKR